MMDRLEPWRCFHNAFESSDNADYVEIADGALYSMMAGYAMMVDKQKEHLIPWEEFETVIGEGVPTTDELISAHYANDAIYNAMKG